MEEEKIELLRNKYHDLCIHNASLYTVLKHKQNVIDNLSRELILKEREIPITLWGHIKHYFSIRFESRNPKR